MDGEQKYKYMVIETLSESLERLLNDLEEMASGSYDIVSVFPGSPQTNGSRQHVTVVIRLRLGEDELLFDEAEIMRKLGF